MEVPIVSNPAPQYDENSEQWIARHPSEPTMRAVLVEFGRRFPSRSRFNISFNAVGVLQLISYLQRQRHITQNVEQLASGILGRVFFAIVALLELEWASSHCTPYAHNELTFQPSRNPPRQEAHWLQQFDISVQPKTLERVPPSSNSDYHTLRSLVGIGNAGSRSDLPPFPLARESRFPRSSLRETETGIQGNLQVMGARQLNATMVHVPDSFMDRFTQAYSSNDLHGVWWQWSGSERKAWGDGLFDKHDAWSAIWPASRTSPAVLFRFTRPPLHPQPRASTGGEAAPPYVLAQ